MRSSHQCVNALAWTLFYKDAQHVLILIVIAIAITKISMLTDFLNKITDLNNCSLQLSKFFSRAFFCQQRPTRTCKHC